MIDPPNSPVSNNDNDSNSDDSSYDFFHTTEFQIMNSINIHEKSNKDYFNLETVFYHRMKMYFLKHKLHVDLKIYFFYN